MKIYFQALVVILILIISSFFYGCNKDNAQKKINVININLKNKDNNDILKIKITEIEHKLNHYFVEEYSIPIRPVWNPDSIRYFTYTDSFFYEDSIGLFRTLQNSIAFSIGDGVGHFNDFLWIPIFMYNRIYVEDTFVTYHDRNMGDILKNQEFGGALNKMIVKNIDKYYEKTYKDTLRTFLFKEIGSPHGRTEYKTYDSKFNLVKYGYQKASDEIVEFHIVEQDYVMLMNFREDLRSIF